MEARKLLETLAVAERLKDTTRHCYTREGRHESVAEHCWMMTLMAYFVRDEFPEADMDKVIRMCLIHDLGEAFTGDIPSFDKTAENEETEERLLREWVNTLPAFYREEMTAAGTRRESWGSGNRQKKEIALTNVSAFLAQWEGFEPSCRF